MSTPATAFALRPAIIWMASLLASLIIVVVLPAPHAAKGLAGYLPLHVILEVTAIAVATMAFGISWVTHQFRANSSRAMVLGVAFLGVALLDLGHSLSFPGMPDFVTPNSAEKAINFWLAARALAAMALLAAAFWPSGWETWLAGRSRYASLSWVLGLVAATCYVIWVHPGWLPRTFTQAEGLTPFKVGFEYALIAAYVLAAIGFLSRRRRRDGLGVTHLALASFTMAMAEFFFTLYANVTDIYNLFGHVYKFVAYSFVYRGLFVETIQRPYLDLQTVQAQQRATLDTLPDLLFEVDRQGVYLAVYAHEAGKLAAPAEQIIGKNLHDVLPAEAAMVCFEALGEAHAVGFSRGKRIALPLAQDLAYFELSVTCKPSADQRPETYVVLSRDVTATVRSEQKREREGQLNAALLDLQQHEDADQEADFLRRGIEHAERLTNSAISFIHFVNDDQDTIELVTWSSATLAHYCTASYDSHYPISKAGIWAEALRQLRPVVFNDYPTAPNKRGLPQGHAALHRLISLPVIQGGKVRMLLGVGNKASPYTDHDVETVQRLADILWSLAGQRRQRAVIHRLSEGLDQSPNPVIITNSDAEIHYVNKAFSTISGYAAAEVVGRNPRLLQSGQTPATTYTELWTRLSQGLAWQGEFINQRKDGQVYFERASVYPIHDQLGQLTHFVAHKEDITLSRESEQRLRALSDFDSLTGLLNKKAFDQRLGELIEQAHVQQERLSLLWFDLDNFKTVNESMGHPAGDELLVAMANRLRACLGNQVSLARYSGDVFVAIVPTLDQEGVVLMARRALLQLQEPLTLQDSPVALGASVGIAVYPDDARTAAALTSAAEVAMYRVKQEGRNGLRFFSPALQEHSQRSLELAAGLVTAVAKEELFVVFQPQQSLHTGQLVGAEALLRWRHPKLGLISPAEFVPIAEQTGAIVSIGMWVVERAAQQIIAWDKAGLGELFVAVNVSAVQFVRPEWVDELLALIKRSGISPHRIEIELTEAVALKNPESAGMTIERLHAIGFRVALDDFGTGYSSLSYLRRYAIDKLKIDQSFIRGIEESQSNREIVLAIIRMAHGLHMTTIAEGVETAAEQQFLKDSGCDEIQGYAYARPLEAPAFVDFAIKSPVRPPVPG